MAEPKTRFFLFNEHSALRLKRYAKRVVGQFESIYGSTRQAIGKERIARGRIPSYPNLRHCHSNTLAWYGRAV